MRKEIGEDLICKEKIIYSGLFFLSLFCLCVLFTKLDRIFYKLNDSFSEHCIYPNWNRCPQYATPFNEHASLLLSQKFTYFTKGRENFVFVSQDDQFVLKFPRLKKPLRAFSLVSLLKKKHSPLLPLQNFKDAYEHLSEETGVVYAHLSPTQGVVKNVLCIDRYESMHLLELDKLPFILQRKARPFFECFDALLEEKDLVNAKELIDEVFVLFKQLHKKGYIDKDPIFDKNFGIWEGKPMILDVGQLEKQEALPPLSVYLLQMTHSLKLKLQKDSPPLYAYYLTQIN